MNHQQIVVHLGVNCRVFKNLFQTVSIDQATWKPTADRWSMLEVINHLYDEEREDFRQRLGLILENPQASWPPIDPEGWVIQRSYNQRDLESSMQNLLDEREKSLDWLNQLENPDWQAIHNHPRMGAMSAELILANWLAHDLFHIRQANDLHFAWLTRSVAPVSLDYSGWR